MSLLTVAEAINAAAARLRPVADSPRHEARLLLACALGVPRDDLIRAPERLINPARFDGLVARRLAREPMALILGRREFWSLDFAVSGATLVPRADSETLVEASLRHFAGSPGPGRILDLGTGTGCLLLALLTEYPGAFGVGIDLVPEAVTLARSNALRLGLAGRAGFARGDWAGAIGGRFDLIVSNPPYIPTGDIPALMPEVAGHEPRSALDGGSDGYDAYRLILPRLPALLAPGGVAVLELGIGQAGTVAGMARDAGLRPAVHLDLSGIQRAIALTLSQGRKNRLAVTAEGCTLTKWQGCCVTAFPGREGSDQ